MTSSFIEELTNLTSLYLSSNQINDISFIEKLTNHSFFQTSVQPDQRHQLHQKTDQFAKELHIYRATR
ncbi:MAG: leucine-rich repeat domain-containing protein [Saprospiraceae bacterium]